MKLKLTAQHNYDRPVLMSNLIWRLIMTNNDVLKRVRYALDLKDPETIEIFKLSDHDITKAELTAMFADEEDENFVACNDKLLTYFLDGLITKKRGKK